MHSTGEPLPVSNDAAETVHAGDRIADKGGCDLDHQGRHPPIFEQCSKQKNEQCSRKGFASADKGQEAGFDAPD